MRPAAPRPLKRGVSAADLWSMWSSGSRAFALVAVLMLSAVAFYVVRIAPPKRIDRHPEVLPANAIIRSAPPAPAARRAGAAVLRHRLNASAAALAGVISYQGSGSVTDRHGETMVSIQYSAPDRIEVTWLRKPHEVVQVMSLGSQAAFLRATPDSWPRFGVRARLARRLRGVWVSLDSASAARMAREVGVFRPATLGRCMIAGAGTLRDAGLGASGSAHVIGFAGDVPGGTRGLLRIAATGPPYPTKLVQWGRPRPGGGDPACPPPSSGVRSQTLYLGGFDGEVSIVPPATAPTLRQLVAGARSGRVTS